MNNCEASETMRLEVLQALGAPSDQDDGIAGLEQRQRGSLANASSGAGHDCDFGLGIHRLILVREFILSIALIKDGIAR